MAGRKPKPTALKILQGNPGKRALNKNEMKVRGDLKSNPPSYMSAECAKVWRETVAAMPKGILKKLDTSVLESFVSSYTEFRRLHVLLQDGTQDLLGTERGAMKANPLFTAKHKAQMTMLRTAVEMGMTPSSRSRINAKIDDFEYEDDEEDGSENGKATGKDAFQVFTNTKRA